MSDWHDINSPGFYPKKKDDQPSESTAGMQEETVAQEEEAEMRLISAEWVPGPKGFQYNDQCFVEVTGEYLKETVRARVRGKLFGIYNDQEVDVSQEVEGFVNKKTGVARMEISKLWFINDDHYNSWYTDKSTPAKYFIKEIFHSRGLNTIDSPMLIMPAVNKIAVDFVEIPDIMFHSASAVPCLDETGTIISALVSAFTYAQNHTEKDMVLFGHADTESNAADLYGLSERRAAAVKALLDNDAQGWKAGVGDDYRVDDYQQCLHALSESFGWGCDPGPVDNILGPKTKAGVEAFQQEYNQRFGESIGVDGIVGPQTWGAVFRVMRHMIEEAYKTDNTQTMPTLSYGNDGGGVYACGESFPLVGSVRDQYESKQNRRVELVFWSRENPPKIEIPADTSRPVDKTQCQVFDDEVTQRTKISRGTVSTDTPDGEIFLDTGSDELGIISRDNIKSIKREIAMMDAFTPYMKVFLSQEKGEAEKDRKAQAQAVLHVMKDFVDAKDDAAAKAIVDNLAGRIAKIKKQILDDEQRYANVTAAGHKLQSGDVREYFWVAGKRMVRIRSNRIRPHNRWFNKTQVLSQIRRELRDANEERRGSSGPAKELELKLFEKKLFDKSGALTDSIEEFNKKCNVNFFDDSEVLDAGVGAQFLRHSAEAAYGANFNWKEEKTIKVGAKAEGSFSLAQAQGHFDINVPNENGFELLGFLRSLDSRLVKSDAGQIFLLVQLTMKGSAFVGACASVSMDLGVSMKEGDKSGGLQAGLELFAGAKAGAETSLGMSMKLLSDDDTQKGISPDRVNWTVLGQITYGVWGAVGIGVEADLKLGYYENRFRFVAKIGLVVKLGAGTFIKGSVDVENGAKLVWTIAQAMNWQHMSTVFQDNVHGMFQSLMANCFYYGEKIESIYDEFVENIDEIMTMTSKTAEQGLGKMKSVDDTFDEYIPGYSGFKQYSVSFLLLKKSYYYLKDENKQESLKARAVKLVETIERERKAGRRNRWKYATWQMKINLIYDMRNDGSGWGLGLEEEDKEDAVIAVLRNVRDGYEFRKIVNGLKRGDSSVGREPVDIDSLLDFSQQDEFDRMKKRYF